MNLQSYIKQLRKYGKRALTIEEILDEFKVSRNYARVALHRLIQSGDLVSPAKAFYVIVPPEYQTYGCIPAEQLIPILMKHLNKEDAEAYFQINQDPKVIEFLGGPLTME